MQPVFNTCYTHVRPEVHFPCCSSCQGLSLAHGTVGSSNAINNFITTFSLTVSLKKDVGVFNFDFFFLYPGGTFKILTIHNCK